MSDNRPLSASLLKRLGEAADGYRDGREIWCVAATKFPHDLEVFFTKTEAEDFRKSIKKTHEIFGPYKTGSGIHKVVDGKKITEIIVKIKDNETIKEITINPEEYDCIFWSEAAVDKFVFPYYARLFDVEYAAKMKKATLAKGGIVLCGHDRKTRWLGEEI